jgi:hydrogenase maturation protease
MAHTKIVGLGNPILGDDGVGWVVVERLVAEGTDPTVEIESVSTGGLSLAERLSGCDRAIIVDAIVTGDQPVGTVRWFPLETLPDRSAGHTASAHDTSLATAILTCRRMGMPMPSTVWVIAVEVRSVYDFTEALTPEVAAAVPRAADLARELLSRTSAPAGVA